MLTIAQNLLTAWGNYWDIENGRRPGSTVLFVIPSRAQDESISVSIASLVAHCHLFQTKPGLLHKSYKVQSRVSLDSLRAFVGAIGGAVAVIFCAVSDRVPIFHPVWREMAYRSLFPERTSEVIYLIGVIGNNTFMHTQRSYRSFSQGVGPICECPVRTDMNMYRQSKSIIYMQACT
jgi:hypothetical protein